ncbi:MAG TPA: outer membrane beta-barrel protein [Bacteroidales bacterium]|nr:outer membrane beta-barrel protein [Bacteroidales bacterium]
MNSPENLDIKSLNRGVNMHLLYNHRFGESGFAVAAGPGLSSFNLYTNGILQLNEAGGSEFWTIPDTITYNQNKLNLTLLEFPLQISYTMKNHISFSLGGKAGMLISDHTKFNGSDYLNLDPATPLKVKFHNHPNLMQYRLSAFGSVGYKWINLTCTWHFTGLFKEDTGPDMFPITIGILVRPY